MNELFNLLVENAIDFLERSIAEFDKSPKYSVIHFYAAIELFIKARLMAEHWTLVITRKQELDLTKLKSGDFVSVNLEEANKILDKVLNSGLLETELKAFRKISEHRNKMVHFYHNVITPSASLSLQREMAKEQLTAWYLLHMILTDRWSNIFSKWNKKLEGIDFKLRKLNKYLQVIFDQVKPRIEALKKENIRIKKCPSCRFVAQRNDEILESLSEGYCLVCGYSTKQLIIQCPDCDSKIIFQNEGFGQCKHCHKEIEPQELAGIINEESGGPKEMSMSNLPAHCGNCGSSRTVIEYKGSYLCASCFSIYEENDLESCDWCSETNAGDMRDSGLTGCAVCYGRFG